VAPVYVDGQKTVTLKGDDIAQAFQRIIDDYVASHYPRKAAAPRPETAIEPQ